MSEIKHIHHYQFDISNPTHAKCFIVASKHYLSLGCDLDAQELYNALETGDDSKFTNWQPFEYYTSIEVLEFILDLAITLLNHHN